MNINKWLQGTKAVKRTKRGVAKKKPVDREAIKTNVAQKGGAIGDIARQRKKRDKALEEIMKGS